MFSTALTGCSHVLVIKIVLGKGGYLAKQNKVPIKHGTHTDSQFITEIHVP